MKKDSFHPLVNEMTETIILGTIPSEISLQMNEYYANRKNQFWKIIFRIFNNGNEIINYEKKKQLLLENRVGLWDVLKQAQRQGSLDENIYNEEFNDFNSFLKSYARIKRIVFNGKKSYDYFLKLKTFESKTEFVILPSTSSANTWKTFDEKLAEWNETLTK